MKLNDSSEPASVGIRCPAPSVGHGLRVAIVCQFSKLFELTAMVDDRFRVQCNKRSNDMVDTI